MTVVDANAAGFSVGDTISFKRHSDLTDLDAGTHQLKNSDKPEFWAYTVTFAYQPFAGEDGDPDTENPTPAETRKSDSGRFYSHSGVYLEAVRDGVFRQIPPTLFASELFGQTYRTQYRESIYKAMAHEVGHAPGGQSAAGDHAEGGIMAQGFENNRKRFTPATLRRLRQTEQWTR